MLRRTASGIMLTLLLVGTLGSVFNAQSFSTRAEETQGSRHNKGLEIYFYSGSSEAYEALKAGDVDFIQLDLTSEQYKDVVSDPTLQLSGCAENTMFQFDFNNNYTIRRFRGVRSPMNDVEFRRALAQMVDKDWIINEVLQDFGERIDAPVPAPQSGYANESVIGENYPYPYDLEAAAARLDAAGFDDSDADGTRNYPPDWPGRAGRPNLDPIEFCILAWHENRLKAGRALADNMRALGIPVSQTELCDDCLRPQVFDDRNYHIYTGGWSLGRYPTYLFGLFHHDNYFCGGSNYVTGLNKTGQSNYPDLDDPLHDVYYATDIDVFKAAVKKATGLLVEYCVCVWLWSYRSWWAYSKNLVGVVNMDGVGLENTYTFLNAYKVDNPATPEDESQQPIRMGTVHPPEMLNILYSQWYYEYAVLDRVFTELLAFEPYNLAVDNPWIAQDWEVSTWYDPQDEETKTKATYWIRKDVYWHAPVTGEEVRQFTAHDVEFTIWYIYACGLFWDWIGFHDDVHHTEIIDDFTIEVYFDSMSIWHVYSPTGPLLPKDEYLNMLCGASSANFYSDGTNCTASTKYIFTDEQVLHVISADINGTPLVEGVDFEIFATGSPDYTRNEIHFLTTLTTGTVTVDYYTPTVDPDGYYLGDLDWTLTFYSIGLYYPVDIAPGVGGYAILNCNPSFFLETPPLGEIDWKWTWTGTTKPRSGYFQINLYDAVRLLKAYGSHGNGEPTANWFPGADIDPTDPSHVGLYDAVTILCKYGTKWGTPPP